MDEIAEEAENAENAEMKEGEKEEEQEKGEKDEKEGEITEKEEEKAKEEEKGEFYSCLTEFLHLTKHGLKFGHSSFYSFFFININSHNYGQYYVYLNNMI